MLHVHPQQPADVEERLQPLRRAYPGASERVYLNTAALGLSPSRASEAAAACLRTLQLDPDAGHHGPAHGAARASAARLVGADLRQIALTPSTTLALMTAADAVPVGAGDNVVTCDLEFMSVVVPWVEKCKAAGAELRVVRHDGGRIEAERVMTTLDDRTRAVVLSSVQWTNGFRVDLQPIGEACEARGIPFIVDAIQQLGAIPLDVGRSRVSFLACGGHKWLGSPSAYGFLYANDGFIDRFRPTLTYAPMAVPPAGDWRAAWTDSDFDPITTYEAAADATRYEIGVHHGALGAAALAGALETLLSVEQTIVARHVISLADRVADGVNDLGLELVSIPDPDHRSGITVFRGGETTADDLELADFLTRSGISVSARYTSGIGGVRVSTHVYNDATDVDALLGATETWLRRGGRV